MSQQPSIPLTPETPKKTDLLTQIDSVAKAVQNTLAAIVGFGALLTASGFIIVNIYLATLTDIQGYIVAPSQYLTAGAGLFILLSVFGVIAFFILRWLQPRLDKAAEELNKRAESQAKRPQGRRIWVYISLLMLRDYISGFASRTFAILVIVYVTLFGGVVYGLSIYPLLPHFIGGGRPISMALVFDKPESLQALGLTVDPAEARRTETLLLLAELTDGVLVADTNNGRVIAVKDDLIIARVDNQIAIQVMTPSPPLAAASTSEPTEAVTPEATETITPNP